MPSPRPKDLSVVTERVAVRALLRLRWDPATDCMLWPGAVSNGGYGSFISRKKYWRVHRVIYHHFVRNIGPEDIIDHVCRRHGCANPGHLRVVTLGQNTIENSLSTSATNARKVVAACGHAFDGIKGRPGKKQGRFCRGCANERSRRYGRLVARPARKLGLSIKDFRARGLAE